MKIIRSSYTVISVFLSVVLAVNAITVRDGENETSTLPTLSSTTDALTITSTPTDNGMAVGEVSPKIYSSRKGDSTECPSKTSKKCDQECGFFECFFCSQPPEIEPTASNLLQAIAPPFQFPSTEETETVAPFPENHKNFGTIESPPALAAYNQYQQQYKEFYEQKNQYMATARPFRFEEVPNQYVVPTAVPQYVPVSEGPGDAQLRNKPYPHWFEGWKVQEPEQTAYPLPENNLEYSPEVEPISTTEGSSLLSSFNGLGSSWGSFFGGKKPSSSGSQISQGHRSEITPKHKSSNSWKKLMKVFTTVVPFGLFLAALTPNLLYINNTEENKPLRLRSLEAEGRSDGVVDPMVQLVEKFGGLEAMEDPKCEDRFFCEMSVLGKNDTSNFVEKGFWYLANETPDHLAKEVGMSELFEAIRNNNCKIYDCTPKEKSIEPEKSVEKEKKHRKYPKKAAKT